jgi:serine/threonine protein kinase
VRNYRLLKTIGKGNFAKVKLARHMPTGIEVRMRREYGEREREETCIGCCITYDNNIIVNIDMFRLFESPYCACDNYCV